MAYLWHLLCISEEGWHQSRPHLPSLVESMAMDCGKRNLSMDEVTQRLWSYHHSALISIDWPVRVESSSISTQSSQALFSTWGTHFAWAPPFHCFIFSLVLISVLWMHMPYALNFRIPLWILNLVHLWHLLLSPFMFRSHLLQETAS